MPLFISGHEVFDAIVKVNYGSSILILDENFSEGMQLLRTLLTSNGNQISFVEIATRKSDLENVETLILDESPTYSSAAINSFRYSHRRYVLVHRYLPDFLIRYSTENILRIIDSWRKVIGETETVDIFLLPKGTFQDIEMMLKSIVDGIIELSYDQISNSRFLTPIRCTIPEYDLRRFEYMIREGHLKIKWGQEFVESFPYSHEYAIAQKMKLLESQKANLRIIQGTKQGDIPLSDRLLLSQIINKDLEQIFAIFPDKTETLLEKIVKWNMGGIVDLQKIEAQSAKTIKKNLNLSTRIMLSLPISLATRFLNRRGIASGRIPAQAYLLRRNVDEAFYSTLFPQGLPAPNNDLNSIEEFLQDVATRMFTYEVIKRSGEDPRNSLNPKLRAKILKIMLKTGYSTDSKIKQVGLNSYEICVEECPICHGIKSEKPACVSLMGAIVGNAVVCFKSRVSCVETSCKAMGDKTCTFYIEFYEDSLENKEEDRQAIPHYLQERQAISNASVHHSVNKEKISDK